MGSYHVLYSYSEETEDEQFPDLETLANWPYVPFSVMVHSITLTH